LKRYFPGVRSPSRFLLIVLGLCCATVPSPLLARQESLTVSGTVRDSATGAPVPYALVALVGTELQVFAGESGRFTLSGLRGGALTLRIQQIGYRPARITLTERQRTDGTAPLVVMLARQPVVLPEVVVKGHVCSGVEALEAEAEGGSILDEAFKNAERLLALERSYPFLMAFQKRVTVLDSLGERTGGWVDTVYYDSRRLTGYRKGRVLPLNEPRGRLESASYFTTSDLAREEFRKTHCFWYAGRDSSIEGFPGYRIDFAPRADVKSVDWAGSLIIDTVAMLPLRSEARMVNLPTRGTRFKSSICSVLFSPITPTLVLELQFACVHSHRTEPPMVVVQMWNRIRSSFIGRSPIDTVRR
jgi:hypothetical protein